MFWIPVMRSGSNVASNYSSMSVVRGELDRGCLELRKRSDYTDYNNLEFFIMHTV